MKVAITGHTRGIGKAFYDNYASKGHECLGFSTSNGYDISNPEDRQRIVNESKDAVMFINNACTYIDDSQFLMLQEIYDSWVGEDKLIVNMSSRITDWVFTPSDTLYEIREQKAKLDQFSVGKSRWPWVLNVKPGMVNTETTKQFPKPKIDVSAVVAMVDFAVKNRMEFRLTTITGGY